jgi:hypothetical protein
MKRFKEFIAEETAPENVILNEASVGRLYQHVQGRNVGIITANRGVNTAKENLTNNRALEGHIKKAGFGFVHVKGAYIEKRGTPEEQTHDTEHSYVVVGDKGDDKGRLKSFLHDHGKKFGQESVVYKHHDSKEAHLHYTNPVEKGLDDKPKAVGDTESLGPFHPKKIGDYHSRFLHKKQAFSFSHSNEEIEQKPEVVLVFEFLKQKSPVTFNEGGEVEF